MPTINMPATGANIASIRKQKGKTIRDIQDACGVSAAAVCKWQKGQCMPTIDNLIIMAFVFGVTLDDLVVVM